MKSGLKYLTEATSLVVPGDPDSLAHFFLSTKGLSKEKIGEYLGGDGDLNLATLRSFAKMAISISEEGGDFTNAIRSFLTRFRLPGEAQKIDRILEAFAESYFEATFARKEEYGESSGVKKKGRWHFLRRRRSQSTNGRATGSPDGGTEGVAERENNEVQSADEAKCLEWVPASASTLHVLAFSTIMLNTDAHNPAMAKRDKMTREQFIRSG